MADYPWLTHISSSSVNETVLLIRPESGRTIAINWLYTQDEVINRIYDTVLS